MLKTRNQLFHFLFFIIGCTISILGTAQECTCSGYAGLKVAYDKSTDALDKYTNSLLKDPNPVCKAKAYEWIATEFLDKKNFDSCEFYLKKSAAILNQISCSDSIFLNLYKQWSGLYYLKGDFSVSLDYTFKLLKAAEVGGNPHEIGIAYTMIAQLFNQTGSAEKGIVYTRLAIPFLNKIEHPQKASDLLFKLSKRYLWYFQETKTASALDSSELFSYQQLAFAKKINNRSAIAAAFSNLQAVAWEKQDFKKAIQFLDSSFLYTDKENSGTMGINYFDKADLLIELKNFPYAKRMADSALYYYNKIGAVPYIAETYALQSKIAKLNGDYKSAFDKSELSRAILDSIRNVEKSAKLTELERKYSQAKNESRIKDLAKQKQLYFLLALAGLFALLGLIFFLRQQALQNKQNILETEQRLNRARMNPHFFFNALSSLQSFALQENDGKALASSLSKFSHIMRETLESSYKDYVTLEQEIDFLQEYLELQKIRFPQKFSYLIHVSSDLEPDEVHIPSMILQPFTENSIEHGFTGLEYPGHLEIDFSKHEKDLLISIKDNGKGLSTTAKENSEHISRASQIVKDRIFLLNVKLKTRASFTIDNTATGRGVQVKIILPLLYQEDIA